MTSSSDLLNLVVAALLGLRDDETPPVFATDAGADVYRPGDWPTQDVQYPRLKARVIRESKQSIARSGPPEFTVVTAVQIVGEVSAPAQIDNGGAAQAEAKLWRLARQVELAVINSYPLTNTVQQIAAIDSQLSYNSDAETHLAGIQTTLALEWYQGSEDFAPIDADDLDEIALAATHYPPTGFSADLQP